MNRVGIVGDHGDFYTSRISSIHKSLETALKAQKKFVRGDKTTDKTSVEEYELEKFIVDEV